MSLAELLAHLDKRFDRLERRLDDEATTNKRNSANLEAHMRRTDELEKLVVQTRTELKPVALHVALVGAVAKGLGLLAAVIGAVVGLAKLFGGG